MIPVSTLARGPLSGINPVAKLGAAFLIAVPLIATIDWVSAFTALVLGIPLIAMSGRYGSRRRSRPSRSLCTANGAARCTSTGG